MIQGKRVLALIPARGGSKGIKDKNIKDLGGMPLIAYTILAAKKSKYVDRIVISTDSERIKETALQYGGDVPFLRPDALASDTATTLEVVIHAIDSLEKEGDRYDILLLLQPTSPLRDSVDIDGALDLFARAGGKGVASVSPVADHPILMRTMGEDGRLKKLLAIGSTARRQDMEAYYRINGSIYVNAIASLDDSTSFNDNPVGYPMERSHSVDIDEMADFHMAEYYLALCNPGFYNKK